VVSPMNHHSERITMNIVVIGGSGLIGSKLVTQLREHGHDVRAPSRDAIAGGVDTITGDGLPGAFTGAAVVIDVSNSPTLDGAAAMAFFQTSTRNLLDAEAKAGVAHHVALSVVGSERLTESGYMRAKVAQERLIAASPIPYSIVHATQFFEFVKSIADAGTQDDGVHLAPALIQPTAADDVAAAVARAGTGAPIHGVAEVAGPDRFRLDEFIQRGLSALGDERLVVTDPQARYFGAVLDEATLLPGDEARIAATHFEDWIAAATGHAR
jgi:uncharacterized protein YbjT (DUF2867 family)